MNRIIMSRIREHLHGLCTDAQCQIQNALGGFLTGGIVRNNLPQAWLFRDERGDEATFHVDVQGNVRAIDGRTSEVDVLIELNHQDLENAVHRQQQPQNRYNVQCLTQKGQTAFNYLRGRFNL